MPVSRMIALACYGTALRYAAPRALSTLAQARRGRLLSMSAPAAAQPRLLLTSTGLSTPQLEQAFVRMLDASCPPAAPPKIAMLVTAQLAPSVRESAEPADDDAAASKRSPGELRRRRWADAKKKGRVLSEQLGVPIECVDCLRSEGSQLRDALEGANCIWVTGGN
eukprot:2034491-Prymnesium_polylepis.1